MTEFPAESIDFPALSPEHYAVLTSGGIDPLVAIDRGYASLSRGSAEHAALLGSERFTKGAREHLSLSSGLFVPTFNPDGIRVSCQVRWDVPRDAGDHKGQVRSIRYDQPVGKTVPLDVHPRNHESIKDVGTDLWVTEGVKKGDALTSLGLCSIALGGVWNWKTAGSAQPDWESVPLRDNEGRRRRVRIVFDADASEKPGVAKAQESFARWLRDTKGADVSIAILPGVVDGVDCKGVDDHIVAGFTLADLGATLTPDIPQSSEVTRAEASRALSAAADLVTDKQLSAEVVEKLLTDRYAYSDAMGWMVWSGHLWERHGNAATAVTHEIRTYLETWCNERVSELHSSGRLTTKAGLDEVNVIRVVKGNPKVNAVREASAGYPEVLVDPALFDGDPDILNTPAGRVDLRTGGLYPIDPGARVTRSTTVPYVAGVTHPDWVKALEAIPDAGVRSWFQLRMGQAITGHMTPDDVMLMLHGGGSNGKTTIMDAIMTTIGTYGSYIPQKLLLGRPDDHPTDLMTLMGTRVAMVEELPDDKHLNVTAVKTVVGSPMVTGRYMRCDFVTFANQSTLLVNTNFLPSVVETDHGTWRRLLKLSFPLTYRSPGQEIADGPGVVDADGTLRQRVKTDPAVHTAILAWLVEGARRWYALGRIMPESPASVNADTRRWRESNDVLFGFSQENLTADPGNHVMSQELLAEFNEYLKALGHGPWSDKTLANRLIGHPELGRRLEKRRVYAGESITELSRPRGRHGRPDSDRYMAYVGLRFGNEEPPPAEPDDPFGKGTDPSPEPIPASDHADQEVMAELSAGFHEPPRVATFDIETPGAEELLSWDDTQGPWARLCGYSVDGAAPVATTDVDELLTVLYAADTIVAHNGANYDLIGLAHHHGADYERLVAKLEDPLIIARQLDPPAAKGGNDRTHYDLDSLGNRMGVGGKHGDLAALKNKYKGYHLIPTDDPDYLAYLRQDVQLLNDLRPLMSVSEYVKDEHEFVGICGGMTLRGVLVDLPLVTERAAAEEKQKRDALTELEATAGLPLERVTEKVTVLRKATGKRVVHVAEKAAVLAGYTSWMKAGKEPTDAEVDVPIDPEHYTIERTEKREPFKSPLGTTEGIAWLKGVWERYGVTNPPRTANGRLCTKRDRLQAIIDHAKCPPDLARILDLMNTANGARVVYSTVLKNMIGGRYHPRMSPEQASGRLSCGISVFGKHGGKVRERGVFVADPGHLMVAFDYDQVDARAVAAHCQDPAYMDQFESDLDFHTANAILVFGDASFRQLAKVVGHGENYGMGVPSLALNIVKATGMEHARAIEQAQAYVDAMARLYPVRNVWREGVRAQAGRGELLDNGFGRMMRPDASRAWTQGPALIGQGTTRDIMRTSILALPPHVRRCILFTVHDELVFQFPTDLVDEYSAIVMDAMTFEWAPAFLGDDARRVKITCGRSRAAESWAGCYEK